MRLGLSEKLGGRLAPERITRVVAKHRIMGSDPADRMTDQPESMNAAGRQHELVARTFERFRTPLLRYLTDLLSRRDEAEDLVQETYLRLMQIENIEVGRARALIFKVATNLAYDRFRQRRARGPHGDDEQLAELPGNQPAPDRIVALAQGIEIVKRTLLDLKPRCRQVFLLRTSAELDYDEIAKRLGISRRTAEREMQHALEVCQRRLGGKTE
jgi:RNA polymerase sigma factor (sigma-70 family)